MADKGTGSIVNLSSIAGRIGLPNGAAYGATKAALASLT
jgi:short-subunit dehydrogenase